MSLAMISLFFFIGCLQVVQLKIVIRMRELCTTDYLQIMQDKVDL